MGRAARAAAWGLAALLALAVYAPLLASSQPLLWRAGEGGWSSPWLATLFDRGLWESALDVGFNSLILPGTPLLLLGLFLGRRALLGALLVWMVSLGVLLAAPTQAPRTDWRAEESRLVGAGEEVTALRTPLPYGYRDVDLRRTLAPPSPAHPLGTDTAGADVLTRLLFGARVSLTVGIFAVALYASFGTLVGAVAGYYGGRWDAVLLRVVEAVMCVPALFLVLAASAFLPGRGVFQVMALIAAVAWTGPARLVRGELLRIRTLDYVVAARAAGFPEWRILLGEALPNALGPVAVNATFGVASAILAESTIGFLGLGDPALPSWGQLLAAGRQTGAWTLVLAPGAAIFVTVGLINLVGEGVRAALDPRSAP